MGSGGGRDGIRRVRRAGEMRRDEGGRVRESAVQGGRSNKWGKAVVVCTENGGGR